MKKAVSTLATVAAASALTVSLGANNMQTPADYNLYVRKDMTCSGSDTEGRIAVGGNAVLQSYKINCMTHAADPLNSQCAQVGQTTCGGDNSDEYGLVVGGSVSWNSGTLVAGKLTYGTSQALTSVTRPLNCKPSIKDTNAQSKIDGTFSDLMTRSASYKTMSPSGNLIESYGSFILDASAANLDYAVFTLTTAQINNCHGIEFRGNSGIKSILINVVGTSVNFSNFGIKNTAQSLAQKILWNMPDVTSITTSGFTFYGSILAPQADFVGQSGSIFGQLWVNSFTAPYSGNDQNPYHCIQVNNYLFKGSFPPTPTPPSAECGNGQVETGEDCDGTPCCTSTCKFVQPTADTPACRPANGECDVPEYCTGFSDACPADTFKPVTTPCGTSFGICDVRMSEHCPGNAAACNAAPDGGMFTWDAFNVLSFDSYTCHGGDVEGRLAVAKKLDVSGYTVGLLTNDDMSPYDLVLGGDGTYTDGSVNHGSQPGSIVAGGVFTAPAYLQNQVVSGIYPGDFVKAQSYFTAVSDRMAKLTTTATASLLYGDGLSLTCASSSNNVNVVQVDTALFNQVNWYITNNCNLTSAWLITLTGNDAVTIKGAPFPGIVERVVYNIQGSRGIYANNGVAANILAPNAQYLQTQGVTYGTVIVGNVTEARQNNKPNCMDFRSVTFTQKNTRTIKAGDDFVYIYSFAQYIPGDLICANGECHKIVSAEKRIEDNKVENIAVLATPFVNSVAEGTDLTTTVASPSDSRSNTPLPVQDNTQSSSAALLTVSMALLAVVAALF